MKFYVEFKNDLDDLTLVFETYDTPIAKKWCDELKSQMSRNSELKENNRLYHFSNSENNLEYIVGELRKRAEIINKHQFYIADTIDASITQDTLNNLHKHFEEMRGGILSPSEYFLNAPLDVRRAIEDYNVLIHRTEDLLNASKINKPRPRIVLTFKDRRRHELSEDDFDYFSLDINFGEVYINYCEVGKPLWDVFKDKDDIVGDHNIRPLKWYSADMMIYFLDGGYRGKINQFWNWFDQNSKFLNDLGFFKEDKKLAIGHIPVARLITTDTKEEVISKISKFNKINRVYI